MFGQGALSSVWSSVLHRCSGRAPWGQSVEHAPDPGIDKAVSEGIGWLCRAQDRSSSADGGVSRHFSVVDGWGPSYPETTGYIIPTFIAYGNESGSITLKLRAKRMLDWLLKLQFDCGGFPGGVVTAAPRVPVTFNTGQIVLGLAAGVTEFGDEYRPALRKAADWLVETQDGDGCWRKHPTPFAKPGVKAYETHVAWALLEAARAEGEARYAASALRNVDWAIACCQQKNGWVENCCLLDDKRPLTHTIGYFLRGVIEAYLYSGNEKYLSAALKTALGLLGAIDKKGRLPGRLNAQWEPAASWDCLTGTAQIAHCWLLLFSLTNRKEFLEHALDGLAFVRRTVRTSGVPDRVGAVQGSFPLNGGYCTLEYPNWATKFSIDANILAKNVLNLNRELHSNADTMKERDNYARAAISASR